MKRFGLEIGGRMHTVYTYVAQLKSRGLVVPPAPDLRGMDLKDQQHQQLALCLLDMHIIKLRSLV